MSAKHATMVVAAARALCKRGAEQCNVDFEDDWKVYGDSYLEDAEAALQAAAVPELLAALLALVEMSDSEGLICGPRLINDARAAIDKATGGAA